MKIAHSERETLLGPAVVGIVVGLLVAACSIAFDSEYGGAPLWQRAVNAVLSSAGGFLIAFLPFGLMPVLIGRLRQHLLGKHEK